MNISFRTKSKKNPASLYVRFFHGKDFDLWAKTGLYVNGKYWSNKKERVTTAANNFEEENFINSELPLLKEHILNEFNKLTRNGGDCTKEWMSGIILSYNNRPKSPDQNHEVFLVPFMRKYIEESKTRINVSTGKPISKRTLQKHNTTLERIIEFEKKEKISLKHADMDLNFHQKFSSFLSIDKAYGANTIGKYITNLKTFLREAKTLGYKVNSQFEHRNFTAPKERPIHTYLNLEEINKIYSFRFNNERLNNARQLLIIGLWTGLRVSDLSRIQEFNFSKQVIEIKDTVKTGENVRIPIHPQVRGVLNENNGKLPRVISDVNFNLYVKEVCDAVGINNIIMGSKKNPKTNRVEKGYFPKNELVSSHTCRRSFATNHYGKLPNQTIMAITTHKSEKQFLSYVKTTHNEHVKALQEYWNNHEDEQ